jgi:hypothetical protein
VENRLEVVRATLQLGIGIEVRIGVATDGRRFRVFRRDQMVPTPVEGVIQFNRKQNDRDIRWPVQGKQVVLFVNDMVRDGIHIASCWCEADAYDKALAQAGPKL